MIQALKQKDQPLHTYLLQDKLDMIKEIITTIFNMLAFTSVNPLASLINVLDITSYMSTVSFAILKHGIFGSSYSTWPCHCHYKSNYSSGAPPGKHHQTDDQQASGKQQQQ